LEFKENLFDAENGYGGSAFTIRTNKKFIFLNFLNTFQQHLCHFLYFIKIEVLEISWFHFLNMRKTLTSAAFQGNRVE